MQAASIGDHRGIPENVSVTAVIDHAGAHDSSCVRSREAILMYLRPASWALCAASSSDSVCRTLASLISIGRLTPAITSTLALSIIEMARLEGVPPNMSVSSTTPFPSSARATLSRILARRCSISSSGPMQTALMFACGPTTCSSAEINSSASRPWVTMTRPIMASGRPRILSRVPSARAIQVAMKNLHSLALAPQPGGELFRDINRTMSAAGAADGDRQIALSLGDVPRQQGMKQPRERFEKWSELLIGANEAGDLGIAAGERLETRFIVRIGQKTHVKNQIGIAWQTRAKGERSHLDEE